MKPLQAIALALGLLLATQVRAQAVNSGHVLLELVPGSAAAAPGRPIWIALRQKIASGWHTYWRNPGDAGEPPKLGWTLPPGWRAGEILWPAPKRLPVSPLMDYGYEGEVYLPVPLSVPASARPGQKVQLKADVTVLVCKELCVPEDATLGLDLPVARLPGAINPKVAAVVAAAPRPSGLQAVTALQSGRLKLAVTGAALNGPAIASAYFFPYASTVIKHPSPQGLERGPHGLTLSLDPGVDFAKAPPPQALQGVLEVDRQAYEVTAHPGPLPAAAAGLGPPARAAGGGLGLPLALAFAFLGGVVLNLMPCVFPILSMKALALASHAGDGARPRAQALAFLAGVLATFVALAAALIAAKAAGAAVGWGFQLQSPGVVAGLSLLMLLIGLNLSGLFEVGLSLQQAGSGAPREGAIGSALTGVLAVVVAAPCTAPFMAGAIGWALTQSELVALLVFAALGLGFAAPFVALAFAPALLRRLPRPGAWMDGLKKVLAFPMYGAAAWLAWVLTQQAGSTALAALFAAAVVLAFSAWVFGAAQRAQAMGGRAAGLYGLSALAVLAAAGLAVAGVNAPSPANAAQATGAGAAVLPSEPFSPARIAELQAEGRPVLVDFTAAWCLTCQVNEQVALSRPQVAQAFAGAKAVYMRADWTRRDPAIAQALAEHGRAGVPLYLVYGPGSGEQVLPQILTPDIVLSALRRAAKPG